MMRTAPRLRLLPGGPVQTVTVQRHLIVGAAMDAKALADDIESALEAIEARLWAGNRAAAVNEIGRAHLRVGQLRTAFLELAGIADRAPTEPTNAAHAVA